jgi:hypothetical protein
MKCVQMLGGYVCWKAIAWKGGYEKITLRLVIGETGSDDRRSTELAQILSSGEI